MDRKSAARLLIADDYRLVAEACKEILQPGFDIVGIVTDGRALVRAKVELCRR